MKNTLLVIGAALGAPLMLAQYAAPTYNSAPPPPYGTSTNQYESAPPVNYGAAPAPYAAAPAPLGPAQLDQLLSPVALYPDPLIGAMLPAATHPDQIAQAAGFPGAADPNQLAQQPWDDSVKALAQYPQVVQWMAQNSDWTAQLGDAVVTEEPAVLDAIQRLRENARASGMLVDSPQQRVVVANNQISILPAQPGTVYVPTYDPQYVVTPAPGRGRLSFGTALALGAITFGLDWGAHDVWFDHGRGDYSSRRSYSGSRSREIWRPSEPEHREHFSTNRSQDRYQVARPAPYSEGTRWHASTPAQGVAPTGRLYGENGASGQFYRSTPEVRTYERGHDAHVQVTPPAPNGAVNPDRHGRGDDRDHRRGDDDREHRRDDDRTPDH